MKTILVAVAYPTIREGIIERLRQFFPQSELLAVSSLAEVRGKCLVAEDLSQRFIVVVDEELLGDITQLVKELLAAGLPADRVFVIIETGSARLAALEQQGVSYFRKPNLSPLLEAIKAIAERISHDPHD
jgi:hypothetical protein